MVKGVKGEKGENSEGGSGGEKKRGRNREHDEGDGADRKCVGVMEWVCVCGEQVTGLVRSVVSSVEAAVARSHPPISLPIPMSMNY
eukprot:3941022-Rhodomonas_salina.1